MSMQMSPEESVQETGYNQLFSVAPNTNNKEYLCGFASIAYPEFYFFLRGGGINLTQIIYLHGWELVSLTVLSL